MIWGVNTVLEALRSQTRPIHKILILKGAKHHRLRELIDLGRAANIPIQFVERNALDRATGRGTHQGVVAHVAAQPYVQADNIVSNLTPDSLLVLLDEVEDPHNLGAILRTAHCAGADAVVITKHRSVGLTQIVAKASAGAIEYIPVARVTNLASFLDELRERGVRLIGVEASGQQIYTQCDYTGPVALIFGSEGKGLRRLTRDKCDTTVFIPMAGKIDSLNVSVAVGVILFEARRQRQAGR
jgi:23S rRNA (guanosine2251-2'-O)-methyltransferase